MAFKLGMKGVLNYKEGGQAGADPWAALTNVTDVTTPLQKSTADATTRANNGWRATVPSLKEGSVDFEMVWDPEDPGFQVIRDAFFNDTVVGLQILDEADGEGLQADFMISNFTRSEPIEEVMKVAVTAVITYSTTPPSWVTPSMMALAAKGGAKGEDAPDDDAASLSVSSTAVDPIPTPSDDEPDAEPVKV